MCLSKKFVSFVIVSTVDPSRHNFSETWTFFAHNLLTKEFRTYQALES
jgi:hypothetical protein